MVVGALLGVSFLVGGWLTHVAGRILRRRVLRQRFERAREGEEEARDLLTAAGFSVLQEQATAVSCLQVDGNEVAFEVRADFLVQRGARRGVVEVKTGAQAPDPAHAATRRQLREYQAVFECDELYLLDADAGAIQQISFPARANTAARGFTVAVAGMTFVVGLIAGILLAAGLS